MTVYNLIIIVTLGLSFFVLLRGRTQVRTSGSAQMTPDQIYDRYQRKVASTSAASFRPYRETIRRESRAFDHMLNVRDSEAQNKNIERTFLTRDLNFTDRELSAYDKINVSHQKAIQELTSKGNDGHAVTKLLAQRKESLVKLMGLKRFDTFMTFRKTQNTNTRFG
jgi:hypothetical protein